MAKFKIDYPLKNNLDNKTDEEIVSFAKEGQQEALEHLLQKYKELINMKVCKYFIIGAEREDIVQEGMIGLYKAIKCFNPDKQSSFKSFANLCIERQLITAIKTSNRQKHGPLNSSLSLNATVYDNEEDTSLIEVFNSKTAEDPLETITKQEYYKKVETEINKNLSNFEKKVLSRYAIGESYTTIADKLDIPVKSVDNAIQRIRKKANTNIINEE